MHSQYCKQICQQSHHEVDSEYWSKHLQYLQIQERCRRWAFIAASVMSWNHFDSVNLGTLVVLIVKQGSLRGYCTNTLLFIWKPVLWRGGRTEYEIPNCSSDKFSPSEAVGASEWQIDDEFICAVPASKVLLLDGAWNRLVCILNSAWHEDSRVRELYLGQPPPKDALQMPLPRSL